VALRVLTSRSSSSAPVEKLHSGRVGVGLVAVAVTAAGLFAELADQVTDHQGLARSDPRLLHDIISVRSSSLTALAKVVTNLGTGVAYLLLAGVGYWYWRKTRSFALPIAALSWMAIGLTLRLDLSRIISRPRPSPVLWLVSASGFAFPSGHTSTATIGFGLMALLLWRVTSRGWRWPLATLATLAALAVGLSRTYLGVHWPTDVLGGWAFGIAWVALGGLICWIAVRVRSHGTAGTSLGAMLAKGGHSDFQ
jgi:undecaprenyl-diphosphatase